MFTQQIGAIEDGRMKTSCAIDKKNAITQLNDTFEAIGLLMSLADDEAFFASFPSFLFIIVLVVISKMYGLVFQRFSSDGVDCEFSDIDIRFECVLLMGRFEFGLKYNL